MHYEKEVKYHEMYLDSCNSLFPDKSGWAFSLHWHSSPKQMDQLFQEGWWITHFKFWKLFLPVAKTMLDRVHNTVDPRKRNSLVLLLLVDITNIDITNSDEHFH